jgi:hypothetical protein
VVSGIVVTESGILAAAHLGGAGSVKRYFKNNGEKYIKDAYGLQYGVTWKHLEDMILHQ